MKRKSINFWGTAIIVIMIFTGYDYVKYAIIGHDSRFTTGKVIKFNSYLRTYNNSIEYQYEVNKVQYSKTFRDRAINQALEGKTIIIEFSKLFPSISRPRYDIVLPDTIIPPTVGWNSIPLQN